MRSGQPGRGARRKICASLLVSRRGRLWLVLVGGFAAQAGSAVAQQPLVVVGADSMVAMVTALADRFVELNPNTPVAVSGGGSELGATALLEGTAGIAMLSRPMTDDERRITLIRGGSEPVGFPVAMDAVVFLVRPDNPIDALSFEQLRQVFSGRIHSWEPLGFTQNVPDPHGTADRIQRHMPRAGSGPTGMVRIQIMHGKPLTSIGSFYDDPRALMQAVGADLTGIGFGSMGYTRAVKVLAIQADGAAAPVKPDAQTVHSRVYPLSHYLYFYFSDRPSGVGKAFLRFVLGAEGRRLVERTGAVPLPFGS